MEYRQQLLRLAEDLSQARGISTARLATLILNDGNFFARLGRGRSTTVDTYLRVKAWFAEHWPEGRPWPEGVDRPGELPVRQSGEAA